MERECVSPVKAEQFQQVHVCAMIPAQVLPTLTSPLR